MISTQGCVWVRVMHGEGLGESIETCSLINKYSVTHTSYGTEYRCVSACLWLLLGRRGVVDWPRSALQAKDAKTNRISCGDQQRERLRRLNTTKKLPGTSPLSFHAASLSCINKRPFPGLRPLRDDFPIPRGAPITVFERSLLTPSHAINNGFGPCTAANSWTL